MSNAVRNAAIYCRISRDAEGEGLGVARQEEACRELADRLGLPVNAVYIDNDIGASEKTNPRKKREQWEQLVEAVEARQHTHVIAYSNSRLTRRMRELEDLIKLHERTDVAILTVVSGNDDLSTSDGRMTARIKASVDAAEAERISERTKAAHRQKALRGVPKIAGNRPFGYMRDGASLEPEEAKAIREAVDLILSGGTITQVRRQWEKAGLMPTGGGEWRHGTLKRSILGWRVAGIRTYYDEPVINADGTYVKGEWPAIITLEERAKALSLIAKRSREQKRQGKWLLSGLLRCGKCGARMYGRLNGKNPEKDVYSCSSTENHLAIVARRLEEHVEYEVMTYALNRAIYGATAEEADDEPDQWPGEARLESINEQIQKLMDAFKNEQLSGDVVFPEVDALDKERRTLRHERETFYAERLSQPRRVGTAEEVWDFAQNKLTQPFEDRQLMLTQELEQVVVMPGLRGGGSSQADAFNSRIKLVWRQPHPEYGTPAPMDDSPTELK